MTFQPVLPWAILTVVISALAVARLVALRLVLLSNTVERRRIRAVLRWSSVTLAVLLLIAATTRPAFPDDENRRATTAAPGENLNVFLVVDRSPDSAVEDYGGGSRIAGIRDDIATLIKQYPAARYALVSFASKPSLEWPLSADVWSLRPTIAALSADETGPDGNAAAPATVLRYQLMQAAQQYPGSRNMVLYFGSGAPVPRTPQDDFDVAQGSVNGGAVFDYGRSDAVGDAELRQIAEQLNVPYIHRQPGQPFRTDLPDSPHGAGVGAGRIELYWLPALLAAGLLLAEIYLSVREFRRGRIARRDLTR